MPYYAPFYRPTYYDPVQQNPMGQFNQQFQPRGCCVTVSVENVSATTAIDVTNANVVFERVC